MLTMEQIKEEYFNYLANEVLEAIYKANRYDCKDFTAIKLSFYKDMLILLQNKEKFEEDIKVLQLHNGNKKWA